MKTLIARLFGAAALLLVAHSARADYIVSAESSFGSGAIYRFNDEGTFIGTFGSELLMEPTGMQLDSRGRLLVADTLNASVQMFDVEGTYLGPFAAGLENPISVLEIDDQTVLVAEYYTGIIKRYDLDGNYLGDFASTGMSRVYQMARNPLDGSIVIAGLPDQMVQSYAQDGTYLGIFSDATTGQLSAPGGLAFYPDGSLLVAEARLPEVKLLDATGNYVQSFSGAGLSDTAFITFDRSGDFFVGNYGGNSIRRFAPDGTDMGDWIKMAFSPYQILDRIDVTLPSAYTVNRGVEIGTHDIVKVQAGDDTNPAIVEQRPQPTPALPNAELRATGTVLGSAPQTAKLKVRLQGNPTPLSSARSQILLRNWNTNQFEVVWTENPMTDTLFRAIDIVLDPSQIAKYIVDGGGSFEMSARIFQAKGFSPAWKMKVSKIELIVTR